MSTVIGLNENDNDLYLIISREYYVQAGGSRSLRVSKGPPLNAHVR